MVRTVGRAIIFGTPSLYKGCGAPRWLVSSLSRSSYPRRTRRIRRPCVCAHPVPPAGLRGILGTYADIGMELRVRFELKADRFRNLKCTPFEQQQALSGCQTRFPTISPVPQYAVRTAGIVGRRLHVNVDFDSQREFDANNNLQVWYEGLEDEVLRRVEAGNVTFQAPAARFISAAIPANHSGV